MLIDTDVLIDVALDRSPHADASVELLRLLESRPRSAFVAWHSLSNLYYLVRPKRGGAEVRGFIDDLTRFVLVAPTDTDALRYALNMRIPDFEDAMQIAAAESCGAEVIVTRNEKHFQRSPIPARTPAEMLRALGAA